MQVVSLVNSLSDFHENVDDRKNKHKRKHQTMNLNSPNQQVLRPPGYNMWVGVFVVFLLLVAGMFYYATQKIEYVWRWNRIPIYFAYVDTIEINSEIDGEVESITKDGDQTVVVVKDITETQSYTVPTAGLNVDEGEMISIGDVLRANLLQKEQQFKDLNEFVNWDYYENWKWGRMKRPEST